MIKLWKYVVVLPLVVLPTTVFASHQNFTCESFGTNVGITCSSGAGTFTGGANYLFDNSPTQYPLTNGVTYYISMIKNSGSGIVTVYCNGTGFNTSASLVDQTCLADGTNNLQIVNQTGTSVWSNFCISNVNGECELVPPAPDFPFPNGARVWGQNNLGSTTFGIIDNPNQDYFNSLVVMGFCMWFPIWFFRRRNV